MTRRTRWTRQLLMALMGAILVALAAAGVWHATRPAGPASLQQRAGAVERTLRCPTCQGLSVAESPSPIAAGMREQVQRQLATGATPGQVRGYFVVRYGDWILLAPPRRGIGWLVWLAPALVLLGGAWLVRRTLRRQSRAASHDITAEQQRAATELAAEPPDARLPEAVAAALTDLQAARVDAELDPAGDTAAQHALTRLAAALRDHPLPPADRNAHADHVADPPSEPATAEPAAKGGPSGARHRRRPVRYALPAGAALAFAGLLAVTLSRAVADRPAGAVPTGSFATTAASGTSPRAPSAAQLYSLERATRGRPRDPTVWLDYATALDAAGRLAAAEPAYQRALALSPASVPVREQLAWLFIRGGSPTEALTVLAPLTREQPDDPQVVLLFGLAQRGADDPHATATLRRYLQLAPDTAAADVVRALLAQKP